MDTPTYVFVPANLDREECFAVMFGGRAEGPLYGDEGTEFFREQGRMFARFLAFNSTGNFQQGFTEEWPVALEEVDNMEGEEYDSLAEFVGGKLTVVSAEPEVMAKVTL